MKARKDPAIAAAEEELVACMKIDRRMPDRERGWLLHSTLRWPAMLRDQGDYPGDDEPRLPVSRREHARWEAMLGGEGYVRRGVAERDWGLLRCVALLMAINGRAGVGWDDVWKVMRGQLCQEVKRGWAVDSEGRRFALEPVRRMEKVTSDAMRVRYARALGALAGAMGVRGEIGAQGEC